MKSILLLARCLSIWSLMLLRNVSLLSVPAFSFRPCLRCSRVTVSHLYAASSSSSSSSRSASSSSTTKRTSRGTKFIIPPKTSKAAANNIQIPTWVPDAIDDENDNGGYSRPVIQWYPGHIAKAERVLKETFQAVDVVIEVRDARAPKATSHPKVTEWVSGKPRLVVMTHVDMVPSAARLAWKEHLEPISSKNEDDEDDDDNNATAQNRQLYLWVDAKKGQGIPALHRAIFKAGAHVHERRLRRGLKDRPLRVGLMGFPNVGKSALINRLLGRKRARTANTPGVTRSLQWIRIRADDNKKTGKKEYELLDSPGIIPSYLEDQSDALLLAACNCIGEASYDNQVVAAYLCQWMQNLMIQGRADTAAPHWRSNCKTRWGFDPLAPVLVDTSPDSDGTQRYVTGEEMVYMVADNTCKGSPEDASRKILQDFRAGRMGPVCLQVAPTTMTTTNNQQQSSNSRHGMIHDFSQVPDPRMGTLRTNVELSNSKDIIYQEYREKQQNQQRERSRAARETAKQLGLELPPLLLNQPTTTVSKDEQNQKKSTTISTEDVGKGLFDGW